MLYSTRFCLGISFSWHYILVRVCTKVFVMYSVRFKDYEDLNYYIPIYYIIYLPFM